MMRNNQLLHPFFWKLKQRNLERFAFIDKEDMDGYMKDVHADVHVEIIIKARIYLFNMKYIQIEFCEYYLGTFPLHQK